MDTLREHGVISYIFDAIAKLKDESDTDEDPRAKALTLTKLEEALMWANKIYNTPKNEGTTDQN